MSEQAVRVAVHRLRGRLGHLLREEVASTLSDPALLDAEMHSLQVRSSDMNGHELTFGWALSEKMNFLSHLWLVDSITTVEDGKRFRIDWRYEF